MRCLALALLALPSAAFAQSLGVAPSWIEVTTEPGAVTHHRIELAVDGPGMYRIDATIGDWFHEDGQSVFHPAGTLDQSAASMLRVTNDEIWVDADAPTHIDLEVSAPAGTQGGFYAVVFVEEAMNPTEPVVTRSRVAVPILVDISGSAQPEVHAVDVVLGDAVAPTQVTIDLSNNGDVHFKPQFRGVVRNGERTLTVRGGSSRFVLPGMRRPLDVQVDADLEPGDWEIVGVVMAGRDTLVPIRHTFRVDRGDAFVASVD